MDELLPILFRAGKFILASGCLIVIYLWLFRGKASYNHCRFLLLSIPILSVLVSQFNVELKTSIPDYIQTTPLVPLHEVPVSDASKKQAQPLVQAVAETGVQSNVLTDENRKDVFFVDTLLWSIYAAVTLLLLGIFTVQFRKILKLKREGQHQKILDTEIVIHPLVPTPFSFYKTVYLGEPLDETKLDLVVRHEFYHIRHKHYLDVLLIQILVRLFWFNPFVWWIRKELVSLEEFQVDQSVLDEGLDLYHYQTVILEEVMAANPFLASGLSDSFTKKRFIMMKQKPTFKLKWLRRYLFLPLLCGLFVLFSTTVKGETEYEKMTPVAQKAFMMNRLGVAWDESSSSAIPTKSLYKILETAGRDAIYSQAYFSYRLNEDTLIDARIIKKELKTLSKKIDQVIREVEQVKENKLQTGDLTSVKALIVFLSMDIDGRRLSPVFCPVSALNAIEPSQYSAALAELKAAGKMSSKVASSSLSSNSKLLKFKYLAYDAIRNNLIWEYLDKPMTQLAKAGQTTSDNILFVRLGRERLRNEKNDARIWKNAPRFSPEQVDACSKKVKFKEKSGIASIKRTSKETRVTMFYRVGGNEWWFYFDKGFSLIDRETRDIYLIKGIKGDIPLNQTIVVTGCCNRYIEFTLIFPPLKKSVKDIDIRELITDRSNIMSDGADDTKYENINLNDYASSN
jgi:hypothetical protein